LILIAASLSVYTIIGIPTSRDELIANVKKNLPLGLDVIGGTELVFEIQVEGGDKSDASSRALASISEKLALLGVAPARVVRAKGSLITMELPGVDDPSRMKRLLEANTRLEVVEVRGGPFSSKQQALTDRGCKVTLATKVVPTKERHGRQVWYALSDDPLIGGSDLRDAHVAIDDLGRFETEFVITQEGAERLQSHMAVRPRKTFMTLINGAIVNAPSFECFIGNTGRIFTGLETREDAMDLAVNLRAGPLPSPIVCVKERTISPSSGREALLALLRAGLVGLGAVMACLVFCYGRAGVCAVSGLLLYLIFLVAVLKYLDVVFTILGVAAVIVVGGIHAGSNILTLKRMGAELHSGSDVTVVRAPFLKTLVRMVDAHLTIVMTSAVLFIVMTAPVKQFAEILIIGLVVSQITCALCSQTFLEMISL